MLLSLNELREKLAELQKKIVESEEQLQGCLTPLADRERLALKCLIARDVFHIAALHATFLRSAEAPQTTGTPIPTAEELTEERDHRPVLAFSNSLFEC